MTISPRSGIPLHQQAARVLRERINSGEIAQGETLPAERDLAAEFGVGVDTVRAAFALLRGQGLLETRRGYRARVRVQPARELLRLADGETAIARMPTPEECEDLDLDEGIPVLVIGQRTYPADRYRIGR